MAADLRYQPLCKELKDVVCFPDPEDIKDMDEEERELHCKILTNYIDEDKG